MPYRTTKILTLHTLSKSDRRDYIFLKCQFVLFFCAFKHEGKGREGIPPKAQNNDRLYYHCFSLFSLESCLLLLFTSLISFCMLAYLLYLCILSPFSLPCVSLGL